MRLNASALAWYEWASSHRSRTSMQGSPRGTHTCEMLGVRVPSEKIISQAATSPPRRTLPVQCTVLFPGEPTLHKFPAGNFTYSYTVSATLRTWRSPKSERSAPVKPA